AYGLARALLERRGRDRIGLLWDPLARNSRFDIDALRRHPRATWHEVRIPALSELTPFATRPLLLRIAPHAYLRPCWLRRGGTRVPWLLTLHDVIPLALPSATSWLRRSGYRWALGRAARAAAVITSSRFSRDEILRLTTIPSERLHV